MSPTIVTSARLVPRERREGIDISTAGAVKDRAARRLTLASWLAPSVHLDKTHQGAMTTFRVPFADGIRMAAEGVATGSTVRKGHGLDMAADAYWRLDAAWEWYVAEYLIEVRKRYAANRKACEALTCGPAINVLCDCRHSRYCHRYIVRSRILPGLGCVDMGEIGDEFYRFSS
jgi:hypothetical protein